MSLFSGQGRDNAITVTLRNEGMKIGVVNYGNSLLPGGINKVVFETSKSFSDTII